MKGFPSKFIFIILAFIVVAESRLSAQTDTLEYGLNIMTYPVTTEKTSLSLDDGKAIANKGRTLKMDFVMRNRPGNVFGCIFRIITDNGENIDLMYTVNENAYHHPILVTSSQVYNIETETPMGRWFPVSISLNPKDGAINVKYGPTELSIKDSGTKGAKSFRIAFGHCPLAGYTLEDVASVDIRDVKLTLGSKLIRHWELSKHDGELCYDNLKEAVARGHNTSWMIDDYISFSHIYSAEFATTPSFTFDNDNHFYMVTPDGKVHDYEISSGKLTVHPTGNGYTPANYPNQLIWIGELHNKLMAYNLDENVFAWYDFKSKKWNNDTKVEAEHDYWNNTSVWDSERDALISFGGYGHYRYNNELSISYPEKPEQKKAVKLEAIDPRYSSASALVNDTLYIFGGRGNKSGKQELSPKNYYDLYAISLNTLETQKLWNYEKYPPQGDFMPSGNMIYDKEKDCFYMITNQMGLTLLKIDKNEPNLCRMSLPISQSRASQYTYQNLYEVASDKKMYAVIMQGQIDGKANMDIYSINTPLIPVTELIQETVSPKNNGEKIYMWLLVLGGTVALGVIIILLIKLKKIKNAFIQKEVPPAKSEAIYEYRHYDFSRSSVSFFGGFTVMNKSGEDITSKFTQTTKALLILLILYSQNGKGILSNKLNHLLWSYKPEDSANNNRNVYMSKLRPLLEEIGDVKIINQNKLWSIQFGEGSLCDYIEAKKLLQENTSEKIDWLLEILLKGVMLPNVELDWVDEFKGEFSNTTIDFLCNQLQRTDLSNKTLLEIVDIIFKYDFLNETAMRMKCRILYKENKAGLAKTVYDTFRKDYKESLGIEFTIPFNEILTM